MHDTLQSGGRFHLNYERAKQNLGIASHDSSNPSTVSAWTGSDAHLPGFLCLNVLARTQLCVPWNQIAGIASLESESSSVDMITRALSAVLVLLYVHVYLRVGPSPLLICLVGHAFHALD